MKITPQLFEAFLKCPTKCWLRSQGEFDTGNEYATWVKAQNEAYRIDGAKRLTGDIAPDECVTNPPETENLRTAKWRFALELTAKTQDLESTIHVVERVPSEGRGKPATFITIRFVFTNKLTRDDKLLAAFDALVLSEVLGRGVELAKIIHGDDYSTLKVKPLALANEVRRRIEGLRALLAASAPPDLILNRHCGECEFQPRCRKIAVEKDDLSLLANLSEKERKKLHAKGIFTVTQLSYTFRPRRRPKRLRDKKEKYHHALKALAIREKKIHIVGTPELKIDGTPVYLDVEGLPDRDFYYLIGVRIGSGETAVQHTLWADTVEDEGKIWREFLSILETVENPVLIHYGSYETTFLNRMIERYGLSKDDSDNAKTLRSSFNLLFFIFGWVYFPTYSNSLKEIAVLSGANWATPAASGLQTIAWRREWERTPKSDLRDRLIAYNQDDCRALALLTDELLSVVTSLTARADVEDADRPKIPVSETAAEVHKAFKAVLQSAHSDYTKARIKLIHADLQQTGANPRRPTHILWTRPKVPDVKGFVIRVPRKRKCDRHPEHPTMLVSTKKVAERSLVDLAFTRTGCRKTVLRYIGKRGRCPHCGQIYAPPVFKKVRQQVYGPGFAIWVAYLRMVLRLSYRLITQVTGDLFGIDLSRHGGDYFMQRCSESHLKTEELLLEKLIEAPAIHADETKISIDGIFHYVWVLTDGRHVIFRLTESREACFLEPLLSAYEGTLVSDFYAGYDALPCRQQKCLVHLIRDLNDDLWKNPFDLELEGFIASVRDLLLPIISDAHKFGLKAFHLRKHKGRVDAFYRSAIDNRSSVHELITKYQRRFQRYRESLFTFLERDAVPWNNNAAERALRHIAIQRKISGAFSFKGAQDYIRLLGVGQSCRFQEKSFLEFLRSGLKDVDAFKPNGSHHPRKTLTAYRQLAERHHD